MIDLKTHIAVGELVQAAAHAHGLTGPVPFRVLSSPPYVVAGLPQHWPRFARPERGVADASSDGVVLSPATDYLHELTNTEAFDA